MSHKKLRQFIVKVSVLGVHFPLHYVIIAATTSSLTIPFPMFIYDQISVSGRF